MLLVSRTAIKFAEAGVGHIVALLRHSANGTYMGRVGVLDFTAENSGRQK